MKKITVILFLALFGFAQAQSKLKINTDAQPFDVVLMETVSKFCTEHSYDFSQWEKAYLKKVIAEKGNIYPNSGSIFSPSNRDQEKANQIAFYILVRQTYGDAFITLTDSYIVFKKGVPQAPSVTPR